MNSLVASYRYLAAGVLTLGAGAVMAVAGDLFHNHGWHTAGPSMIPAGILISIALALAVGAQRPPAEEAQPTSKLRVRRGARVVVVLLTGVPMTSGVPLRSQLLATLLSLLSGLVMVVAGYQTAESRWWLVPPLAIAAGVVISGSFAASILPARRALTSHT